ncbi:fumarylacetoacetate hydrolase family protein [Mucilaginibacter myungsuensis]|uniref:Fumarylacetoacetate hydrolase family protein n=1 Tax=Mucilaginibacter myungsuensis TaxID=649104 RepID=A0A929KXK7_9SPHI|nr:fumarylacetoacetate hydrolase family protein [Mucilaginibacter myungsuensis]MBE9661793.1 fumarylacetoacetate hydrolase family protein [Mucilaginibacter myungsuensis]MDN3599773.1 fumarylacetoacetate hydrolase family protein [Mucilaginibacter myungsuensis]
MKLVSYKTEDREHLGIHANGHIYNVHSCDKLIPDNMKAFLEGGDELMERAKNINGNILSGKLQAREEVFFELMAPVPHPTSCRDGYAFRQHVAAARRNRKVDMIAEFDQFPIFYFTNHNAIQGVGEIECMPDHFQKLDFELEVAVVIGKKGRNFTAAEADDYIAGYMIMNDMSARTLQMEEMLLNLGPAKGKDFSTVIGPWLVTPDELERYKVAPKPGHVGNAYNLQMNCSVNGKQVSAGNMADMDWTFAEIIERCAYGCDVLPGDVIGSGTVGTGCFLELNGTGLLNDPNYPTQWLQPGDLVEMDITGLGVLSNVIKAAKSELSLLGLKK